MQVCVCAFEDSFKISYSYSIYLIIQKVKREVRSDGEDEDDDMLAKRISSKKKKIKINHAEDAEMLKERISNIITLLEDDGFKIELKHEINIKVESKENGFKSPKLEKCKAEQIKTEISMWEEVELLPVGHINNSDTLPFMRACSVRVRIIGERELLRLTTKRKYTKRKVADVPQKKNKKLLKVAKEKLKVPKKTTTKKSKSLPWIDKPISKFHEPPIKIKRKSKPAHKAQYEYFDFGPFDDFDDDENDKDYEDSEFSEDEGGKDELPRQYQVVFNSMPEYLPKSILIQCTNPQNRLKKVVSFHDRVFVRRISQDYGEDFEVR